MYFYMRQHKETKSSPRHAKQYMPFLIEPNRRNAVELLVTGKFTIKLQMESIL